MIILKISGISIRIENKSSRKYILLSGLFLTAHWITYFFALQLSSVALGMLSLFTYPVITVILEPFYLKTAFRPVQVPVSLLALAGIYMMLPSLDISNHDTLGILIGVFSAFLYAIRNLLLKKHVSGQNSFVIISVQLAVVTACTLPFLFFLPLSIADVKFHWYYLLFLGVVTTALGHNFFIKSLAYFSVSTVSILSNFTPVVGILLGILLLDEKLTGNILAGGSLILVTAVLEVWLGKRKKMNEGSIEQFGTGDQ
jgi:drug/metabolite transporter (DMT)-like permease